MKEINLTLKCVTIIESFEKMEGGERHTSTSQR